MISDLALFEVIKNVGSSIHAARLQWAFLLTEVIKRNVLEGDIVEIEIAAKIELDFDETREPAPENPAPGQCPRQPAQKAQTAEWRIRWVIDKIAPVAMLSRPSP